MIALRFQDIVIFVFGFPATAASSHDQRNRLSVQIMVGDKGIVVQDLAVGFSRQSQFTPMVIAQEGNGLPLKVGVAENRYE